MIRARVSVVRDGLQLKMRGHATGDPIVCAGASGIVWALAGWLHNHKETEATISLRAGDAFIQSNRTPEAETAFDVATVGLLQLEKKCPELIRVEQEVSV